MARLPLQNTTRKHCPFFCQSSGRAHLLASESFGALTQFSDWRGIQHSSSEVLFQNRWRKETEEEFRFTWRTAMFKEVMEAHNLGSACRTSWELFQLLTLSNIYVKIIFMCEILGYVFLISFCVLFVTILHNSMTAYIFFVCNSEAYTVILMVYHIVYYSFYMIFNGVCIYILHLSCF